MADFDRKWWFKHQEMGTLWQFNIANWKIAIEIVDLPIKHGDFP